MKRRPRYPTAALPKRVGTYPARAGAGGGYVWDEVLEYRVWWRDESGDVCFRAFASYPRALAFAKRTRGTGEPLDVIRGLAPRRPGPRSA